MGVNALSARQESLQAEWYGFYLSAREKAYYY